MPSFWRSEYSADGDHPSERSDDYLSSLLLLSVSSAVNRTSLSPFERPAVVEVVDAVVSPPKTSSTRLAASLGERSDRSTRYPSQKSAIKMTHLARKAVASAADRQGFQQLVAEVSMGRAGVGLGLEVSRLARPRRARSRPAGPEQRTPPSRRSTTRSCFSHVVRVAVPDERWLGGFRAESERAADQRLFDSSPCSLYEEYEECSTVRGVWTPRWTPGLGDSIVDRRMGRLASFLRTETA